MSDFVVARSILRSGLSGMLRTLAMARFAPVGKAVRKRPSMARIASIISALVGVPLHSITSPAQVTRGAELTT